MKQLIERWKALPKWQREAAFAVAGSASVWFALGAAAALAYGIGVGAGFVFGYEFAGRGK